MARKDHLFAVRDAKSLCSLCQSLREITPTKASYDRRSHKNILLRKERKENHIEKLRNK